MSAAPRWRGSFKGCPARAPGVQQGPIAMHDGGIFIVPTIRVGAGQSQPSPCPTESPTDSSNEFRAAMSKIHPPEHVDNQNTVSTSVKPHQVLPLVPPGSPEPAVQQGWASSQNSEMTSEPQVLTLQDLSKTTLPSDTSSQRRNLRVSQHATSTHIR